MGGEDFREALTSYFLNNKVIFALTIMISWSFKIRMTAAFTFCAEA